MTGAARTSRLLKLGSLLLALGFAVYVGLRITAFVHIFYTHAGTVLTQTEIADAYQTGQVDHASPAVPRVIHQIFHNWTHPDDETLPSDWSATRQTCVHLNPEWEHWLWTAKTSRDFIRQEYPWFLPTYDQFKFPIQKTDALRYFLMRHYGGIYIDLDNGCLTTLEPLLFYPVWVTDGGRGALSNNILGAQPNHPFWILVTDSIKSYAWNYPLPYLTISYATGQWFETVMWEKYHRRFKGDADRLVRVLMDGQPSAPPWVFFNHTRGGTWDNWDNRMFKWIGEHVFLGLLAVVVVLGSLPFLVADMLRLLARYRAKQPPQNQTHDQGWNLYFAEQLRTTLHVVPCRCHLHAFQSGNGWIR